MSANRPVSTAPRRAAELYALGVASSADGRPAAAIRHLRAALGSLDGEDAVLRGRILLSLAWAETQRGNVEAGFRLLDQAEPLIPVGQRGVLAGQRALLLRRVGRDDLALRQFDLAIGLLGERSQPLDLVKALINRALLHLGAARTRPARADLRRAADLSVRHGFELLAAGARHNLGDLELLSGDIPTALGMYRDVARAYERLSPGKLPELAIDLARALLAAGLYGEADRELASAMEQSGRQRLTQSYADALLARAEAALLAGRAGAALQWANRARRQFTTRHNPRRAAVAALLALRANYVTAGGTTAFVARTRALSGRLDGFGLPEDARVARLLAARALAAIGRSAEAEQEVGGIRRRATDRVDTRVLWRLARGEVATASGRRSEALRQLSAGLAELQRYRSQLGCLDLQTGAAVHGRDLASAGLSAALATGSIARLYRWSEQTRAQALLLPPVRPPDDPETVAQIEELRQVRHALRQAELAGWPASALRGRAEALQRRIRERAWSAAGPRTAAPAASLSSVRDELGDAAMVVYLRDGPTLHALVIVADSARLVRLGRYSEAQEAVLRLRADLDTQAGRAMPRRLADAVEQATRRDAAMLGAGVLQPLLPLLGDRELVIVPTGVLVTVPWAVVPGCVGRPVTVAPSATTWRVGRTRLRALDPTGALASLLVAGPGNERGEPEVHAIAALRPHATVLIGPAATATATLAAMDGVAIAHLAAHGRHEPDNALFSTLELAGGPLMGYDVQRVGAAPAIVVLSSCDLGLSDVRPGDETLGMVSALLSAGSSAVIASVSRVADESAMAVMTACHQDLRSGCSAAAALAAAAAGTAGFVCFGAG